MSISTNEYTLIMSVIIGVSISMHWVNTHEGRGSRVHVFLVKYYNYDTLITIIITIIITLIITIIASTNIITIITIITIIITLIKIIILILL